METTLALFERLSSELSLHAATRDEAAVATRHEAELQEVLRARLDLPEVLRDVLLDRAPVPIEPSEVLRTHRGAVRIQRAAELLTSLDPRVAMPVVLEVSRAGGSNGRFAVKKVAHALLERDASLWMDVLDPNTGLDTIRYCLANLRPDARRDVPRSSLERLARRGVTLDLIVPLLAVDDAGIAVVRDVLTDAAIAGDERAQALATVRYTPRMWELARAIVRSGTHDGSPLILRTLLFAYQDAGVDVAFERGDGLRVRARQELADTLVAWEREADGAKPVDVGLVPMHRGVLVDRGGEWVLTRARDQAFYAAGRPCWRVRYQSYDGDADPNEVELIGTMRAEERVDASRLRPGAYLRRAVALRLERVDASRAHPFVEEAPPNPLPVRWWRAATGPDARGWSVELALLPLHDRGGEDDRQPQAYGWYVPAHGDGMPPPTRLRVYAIVLCGEDALDAAVDRERKVSVELSFPLVTRVDEAIYETVLRRMT